MGEMTWNALTYIAIGFVIANDHAKPGRGPFFATMVAWPFALFWLVLDRLMADPRWDDRADRATPGGDSE